MNNKKLFDYIDQYGGDSNNFIKINNLDSMMDFESSDVLDNTEDYTSSLLSKILSNGSTNDNEDNNQLSDISGGIALLIPALSSKLISTLGPGAKKLAVNAVSQASQSVNKSVDHSGDHPVDTSKKIDRTTSVKKNKSKTKHKHNGKKHSVETEHKHNKHPVEIDHTIMLTELKNLKKKILDYLNEDEKKSIKTTEEPLTLDDMMKKLKQMKKQLTII
jgi:hypothetical protein